MREKFGKLALEQDLRSPAMKNSIAFVYFWINGGVAWL